MKKREDGRHMVKVFECQNSCQDNVGLDFSFSLPYDPTEDRDIRLKDGSYRKKELNLAYL